MSRRNKRGVSQLASGLVPLEQAKAMMEAPPYFVEEQDFGMGYSNKSKSDEIQAYMNGFAQKNAAEIFQVIPTAPGAYLFIWEMP